MSVRTLFLVILASVATPSLGVQHTPPGDGTITDVSMTTYSPDEWVNYGLELARSQRFREAEHAIDNALIQSPANSSDYLHDLALVYAWNGNYDAAITQLNRGLSMNSGDANLIASRSDILAWEGNIAAATDGYRELVGKYPDNATYWLKLAQAYATQNRIPEAEQSYKTAQKLAPLNNYAYLGLANLYLANNELSKAEEILRDGLSKLPNDTSLSNALTNLASRNTLSIKNKLELGELAIFALVILVIARNILHDRRKLQRRKLITRILLPSLFFFALLITIILASLMVTGSHYEQVSAITQILEPILVSILLTLILIWRFRFERPSRQKTVLAIGAHPDDIEFGCGATLLRMREEGAATYGLVLTGGERGHDKSETDSVRIDEARAAAEVMALCDIKLYNFPDTSLHEHKAEIRQAIENALRHWRPDIIFTHNGHDVHTDHHTVFEATREAARGAYTILFYENPNTPPEFKPELFYDVEEHLDGKIAALTRHKTQMGKSYAASSIVRAIAGFRGTQARVNYAEGFEIMRVVEKAHA